MGAMLNVLTGFGVVVLIIGLGYVIGRKQLLGPKALYPLNMYVFWIALPATLLRFMSHADLGQIFGPNLAVVAISSLLTGFTSFALFYWIARRTAKESLIGMLAASYCNGSNLGIPLATYLLDDPTLTLPVILFQVGLYAPTAVLLLDIAEERGSGAQSGASRTRLAPAVASALFKSPLLISAFAGMILAWMNTRFGFELPALIADPIDLIAQSMVAVALVVFGMSMAEVKVLQPGISPRKSVLVASLLKTVLHPTLAFLVGTLIFGASGELLLAMVLMGALPTGQNVFTYAQRFQTQQVLARDTGVVSTAISLPIMAGIVLFLG
ncbi:AEC family transporter [Corynebacterium urealyticum]|uniref:AEC family transporter n=1 Tax=Corynebacterium urealyticum TaxID=43771 RepID=UPI0002B3F797|nr:AEC family transporter [Corynebacterium urealyticum]AGE36112.1 putative membrane protein [Corynebacterium urealyticum DSM 7111]QQB07792.1 AEC family transporter [Corynebacterium urealyticum]TYR15569.1 AEC family transporter [Corynebacterium urealyticum]TYR17906.1 AEC family transporter [Corynebacterium urealyticum]TYT21970.1 AEC family transporter [Corynebacterium urealyticum]